MKYLLKLLLVVFITNTLACANSPKGIQIVPDEAQQKIDILYDGKLFTSYLYAFDIEKPVLYPIYTANGTVITRGFPRKPRPHERIDHPHHIGLWFNFGDVNGLDFWNNSYAVPPERKPRYGSIRHRKILTVSEGTLVVEADWIDHTGNALLKEQTHFIFSGEGDWRIVERRTKLSALQDTATFTDNKEGLIAIRMDRAFEEPTDKPEIFLDSDGNPTEVKLMNKEGINGIYRNSNGLEKGDVWGKPANWVSLSAGKDGEQITVTILDHRENPGYPAHSHARGYGLFATNNMGSQVFNKEAPLFTLKLNPGESVTFKHLIIIKTGGFTTDEELNQKFSEFHQDNTSL